MRSGFASLLVAAALLGGCVSDLKPLPPRRVAFTPAPPQIAPPPDVARPAEAPIVHERYGGWILLADLLSIVPLTYWMVRPKDAYLAAPALLLAPAIHVTKGEPDRAATSLILRSLMVGGVYLAGKAARKECENDIFCYPLGTVMLAELAIIPVMVVDAIFLARTTRPERSWHRLPAMRPALVPAPGGASLGVLGRF